MFYTLKQRWMFSRIRRRLGLHPNFALFRFRIYYVCKYDVAQQYGGPEEGGWWYDSGYPVWRCSIPVPFFEEFSYMLCRWLNEREHERAEREEEYGYTSVLSYRSTHYSYGHSDTLLPKSYPSAKPYYC